MVTEVVSSQINTGNNKGKLSKGTILAVNGTASDAKILVSPQETIDQISLIDREIARVIGKLVINYSTGEDFLDDGKIEGKAKFMNIDVDFFESLFTHIKVEGTQNKSLASINKDPDTFNSGIMELLGLLVKRFGLTKILSKLNRSPLFEDEIVENIDTLGRNANAFLLDEGLLKIIFRLIQVESDRLNRLSMQ